MRHLVVRPVRVRGHSNELGVDVVRVVGYRLEDGDGWHGPTGKTVVAARVAGHAALNAALLEREAVQAAASADA